jgi:branched-chain amino acid transport system substrate-binding protein
MNKKTKISLGALLVLIAATGLWHMLCQKPARPQANSTPVKIGVIGHFSGKYADYGIPLKKATELAVEEINQKNSRKIELVIEDDNSDANNAATAINKLINVDQVNYIISAQGSGITAAVTPIAQENKKILMITLGSAPDLTSIGDYIFRSVPSDTYQAVKMNNFINSDLKSKKVAGLYLNDSYGNGIKKIIESNSQVEPVSSETFESAATDFRTQLLKIKNSDADTLVIVAHDEYPLILKQLRELKLNVKIIASETFKDEKILKNCGESAEGVYATFMAGQKDYVDFNNKYQAKFNEKPSAYSMYAYDGMMALGTVINSTADVNQKKPIFRL